MTTTEWTPESEPTKDAEELSATGMFLRAFGRDAAEPPKQSDESIHAPKAAIELNQAPFAAEPTIPPPSSGLNPGAADPQAAQPGEFTRMFQTSPVPKDDPLPAQIDAGDPKSTPAPGEFTRIFVQQVNPPLAAASRPVPEPPPPAHPAPSPSRMKGFSTPGVSDSASGEGGFTQFFQARPPAAPPPARVQTFSPPAPLAAPPSEEFKWPVEPNANAGHKAVGSVEPSTGVTGLFASLGAAPQQQAPTNPWSAEPLPSHSAAHLDETPVTDSGSVTRLIQRLSQGARTAPPIETSQPPAETIDPPVTSASEPGEFTRIISGAAIRTAVSAPAPPRPPQGAAPPLPAPISVPHPAVPHPAVPPAPLPVVAPPHIQAPQIQTPQAVAPKSAPPPIAAPKSKLQEMLPILLVVNTFLLIVLIVVVIFAIKAK